MLSKIKSAIFFEKNLPKVKNKFSFSHSLAKKMEGEKIRISQTSKGNDCIVDEFNFVYHKNNYKPGYKHISWKCSQKHCRARIKTTPDYKLVGELPLDEHCHFGNKAIKRTAEEIEKEVVKRMAPVAGVQLKHVLGEIRSKVEVIKFILNHLILIFAITFI